MNTAETVKTIVENNFQDEKISTQEIMDYITKSDVFFGICEESEDMTYLRETYVL